ncbi:hypothetical protein EMIT0196MI5_160056 [Pseudomonas sp. IT-196MI5]
MCRRVTCVSSIDSGRNISLKAVVFPCGSEPAREEGVSVNINVTDTPPSRAGSLPQVFSQ